MTNAQRGISLTELLVVMSTSTVALVASIGLLRQAMTQQKLAERQCGVHRQAERLAVQFRHDVHVSDSIRQDDTAPTNEAATRWVLTTIEPDGASIEVSYEIRNGEVIRISQPDGRARQIHRESYRFGDGKREQGEDGEDSQIVIEMNRIASPDRMQLRVKEHRLPAAVRNNAVRNNAVRQNAVRQIADDSNIDNTALKTVVNIESVIGKHLRFGLAGIIATNIATEDKQ